MSSNANGFQLEDLTRRYAAAFAARDLVLIVKLLHEEVVLDDPQSGRIIGKPAVSAFIQNLFNQFQSIECQVVTITATGSLTALEFVLTLNGARITGVDVIEWCDGRMLALRAYVNTAPLPVAPKRQPSPAVFLLDVDGVMTDGRHDYTVDGKTTKRFGPDDHDALNLLRPHLLVRFVSGDSKGFAISRRRIETDMNYPLDLVSTTGRVAWIAERYPLDQVIYMGDGIFDPPVLKAVGYGIAPADADPEAITAADYVTRRPGGHRAVAEACRHILAKFFEPLDIYAALESSANLNSTAGNLAPKERA